MKFNYKLLTYLFVSLSACAFGQNHVSVFADFLWWKADVEVTEVGERLLSTRTNGDVSNETAKIIRPLGKWEPGFRLGVGYKPNPCDTMDLSLTWTRLNTCSDRVSQTAPGNFYNPSISKSDTIFPYTVNIVGPSALSLKACWRLKTNILDLDVGKELLSDSCFSFKPHVGIRFGWFNFVFDQKFEGAWYSFVMPYLEPVLTQEKTSFLSKFTYKGAGLKFGVDANWNFCRKGALLAKVSGSLLDGKYDMQEIYDGFQPNPLPDGFPALLPYNTVIKDDLWRVRTNVEGFLGLTWKEGFCANQYQLELSLGYEISEWFILNSLPFLQDKVGIYTEFNGEEERVAVNVSFFERPANGNISYNGLTAKASLDF